ncbi:MAG: hypothetical protein VYE22_11155 [Myxococcota bacterium]|nr:hypothetical protein [Myxococcota bacterium]
MSDEEKRPLSQGGGPVRREGDAGGASVLARAFRAADREDPLDTLTHGFHSWPAGMHWAMARTVLEAIAPKRVLDPFCGGGTVLVEARVLGAKSAGVDLNPLSKRVAKVRADARDAVGRSRFLAAAHAVAEASEARVRERVPIRVDLPERELRWYDVHVLKELGGLREEIRAVPDRDDRVALAVCLSSILVKVSRQRSDTAEVEAKKRIRKGLSTELFLRKAKELAERWAALHQAAEGPPPLLFEGDVRRLPRILGSKRMDLILTSPPYGGTYDYAAHHARRIAFLDLDDRKLRRLEIGARRESRRAGAADAWDREVDEMLEAMRAVLRPHGQIVLLMGDAQLGRERVPAPPQIAYLSQRHGLAVHAVASQRRPDWTGERPREEHLIWLKLA